MHTVRNGCEAVPVIGVTAGATGVTDGATFVTDCATWAQLTSPDRFDSYSVGVMLLQMAIPQVMLLHMAVPQVMLLQMAIPQVMLLHMAMAG